MTTPRRSIVEKGTAVTNEASSFDNEDDPELNAQIRALIKELNLSMGELQSLFRAATTTPEQYTSNPDQAPERPISKRRMLAFLEMRKRLMSEGTSDAR